MRRNKAAASAAILGLALVSQSVAQETEVEHKAIVASVMQITAHSDDEITGVFARDSLRISFKSRMETPSHVVLRVQLGDVALDAEADFEKDVRVIDGHGHALTLDERMALLGLTGEFERYLDPYRRTLSPNTDLLFRVVSYWAEAPVGWPLKRHVFSTPIITTARPIAGGSQQGSSCNGGHDCVEGGGPCEQDSDDGLLGIILLGEPCVLATYNGVWHDASSAPEPHCYCEETLQLGCNLNAECDGRCGPGCGVVIVDGAGAYTLDCAEHDRCCRYHGGCLDLGAAAECGDEYDDAVNDWILAPHACALFFGCDSNDCWSGCFSCATGTPNENNCPPEWEGDGLCDCGCQFDDCCDCTGGCDSVCGDDDCGAGETYCSCPQDCNPVCGDGCCTGSESCSTCPGDCGGCEIAICAEAGAHGTIDPVGCVSVPDGGNLTFTASSDSGYEVNEWRLDWTVVQTGGNSYTIPNVQASHTLRVTFKPIDFGELTIERPAADVYRTDESSTMFSGRAPSNTHYVTWTNEATGTTEDTGDPPGADWQDRVHLTDGENLIVIRAYDSSNRLIATASKLVIKVDTLRTISVHSTEECFVASGHPSSNYGGGLVNVGLNAISGIRLGKERALVRFDLSSIPAGSTVQNAQFGAKNLEYFSSGAPISVTLYRATGSWSEGSVTWNSKPGYSSSGSDTTTVSQSDSWVYWDASSIATKWINQGYANYGVYLITNVEGSSSTRERVFDDDDFKLRIEYEVETVSPSVAIAQPTAGGTYYTNSASVTLSGTASDNFGVSGVTCLNQSTGTSINASGTNAWVCTVALEAGRNEIVVVGRDSAGNTGTDAINVHYLLSPANVVASDGLPGVVLIEWDAVVGASHYHVHRATSQAGAKEVLGSWQVGLSYPDTPPQPDRDYWYWVTAAADNGGTGETDFGGPDSGFFRIPCDGHADCQNGSFCDGAEICEAGGCVDGPDPCVDEGHCDEENDRCICLVADDCDDGVSCTADVCNQQGECEHNVAEGYCLIGGVCEASGQANSANECEECNPAVDSTAWLSKTAGATCGDPADTDCDNPDTCDGRGVCLDNPEPPGTLCGIPLNDCTSLTCDGAGTCGLVNLPLGTPCGDPADTDCDNPDSCDGQAICLGNHEPSGTSCEDESFCNGPETCNAGICMDGSESCIDRDHCDEELDECICTGDEECDDSVACTNDTCENGTCDFAPDDDACDNGLFCDGMETCDAIADCQSGAGPCNDELDCTTDTCDEALDECDNDVEAGNCRIDDVCYAEGAVKPGNSCQSCQANTNPSQWSARPDGTSCDDGNSCTSGDTCSSGSCTGTPIPCCGNSNLCCGVNCTDEDLCTTDTCDPVDGSCHHEPVVCPNEQTCDPNTGACVPCTADSDCDDDNPCTDDTCDSSSECVFTPNDTNSCDDGDLCNGTETCENGACVPGIPVECDVSDFCNGAERCVDGICEAGTPPCTGAEICDEDNQECLRCDVELDDGRVVVCHLPPGNPDNPQTLIIGERALNGHLNHGDYEGACNCPCETNDDCPAGQACPASGICCRDTDGDGVCDDDDECADTPPGEDVDASDGCRYFTWRILDPNTGAPVPGGGPSEEIREGEEVLIDAPDPPAGQRFSHWDGDDVPSGRDTDNPLAITMDSDKSIFARFDDICTTMCGAGCGCTPGAPAVGLIFLGLLCMRFIGPSRPARGRG